MLMISSYVQQLNSEMIMNDNLINAAFFHQYQNQSGVSTGGIINVFNDVHCTYVAHF